MGSRVKAIAVIHPTWREGKGGKRKEAEIECVERGRGRRKRRGDISLAVGG